MPRKSLDSAIEHRITFGNYERALVTEIKTDIEKGVQIAAIGAIAVPATLGIGLVGGMGLLGYGLYQGLSSFGFGNITKEIKDELVDAKNGAWCWWTNKNRKFWGLEPVDCNKKESAPPSRREKERTDAEQLEYENYREERKRRTQQRKDAMKKEMGEDAYNEMIDNFNPADHSNAGVPTSDEEKAARAARAAAAAADREEQRQQEQAERDAYREERRRRQEEEDAAAANQEDDSGDLGGSNYGGGSSAGGGDTSDNSGDQSNPNEGETRAEAAERERNRRGNNRRS